MSCPATQERYGLGAVHKACRQTTHSSSFSRRKPHYYPPLSLNTAHDSSARPSEWTSCEDCDWRKSATRRAPRGLGEAQMRVQNLRSRRGAEEIPDDEQNSPDACSHCGTSGLVKRIAFTPPGLHKMEPLDLLHCGGCGSVTYLEAPASSSRRGLRVARG